MPRENHLERRQSPRRLLINPPVTVSVGETRSDLLYDLSRGGVSVYGLVSNSRDELFPITFDLPGGGGSIKAFAEIAWTSGTQNRTGIRFLNVMGASQQRLADWVAAPSYGSRPIAVSRNAGSAPSPEGMDSHAAPVSQLRKNELTAGRSFSSMTQQLLPQSGSAQLLGTGVDRPRPVGKFTGLAVTVALLFLVFGFAHHYSSKRMKGKAREVIATALPKSPSKGSSVPVENFPSTTPPLPVITSLDVPGFVLQVGAMKNENNADALSKSLKLKNLPAFVFKRKTDHFYRVAVGPYADMPSAMRIKNELQRENMEAILKRWVPERRF